MGWDHGPVVVVVDGRTDSSKTLIGGVSRCPIAFVVDSSIAIVTVAVALRSALAITAEFCQFLCAYTISNQFITSGICRSRRRGKCKWGREEEEEEEEEE